MREQERAAERADAHAGHIEHERMLTQYSEVLRERTKADYDWPAVWAPRGPFSNEEFAPPAKDFDERSAAAEAAAVLPTTRPFMIVGSLAAFTYLLGGPWAQLAAILSAMLLVVWLSMALRKRKQLAATLFHDRTAAYHESVKKAQEEFENNAAQRRADWESEEEYRARVREARGNVDIELLTDILEAELANEPFPIPVVFEVEIGTDGTGRVEFVIPDFSEIPLQRTQLTKTGKLSYKKLAQRDRVGMYEDLCTGIALRLAFECFRVLEHLEHLEVFGTAEGIDSATGHNTDFVALHARINKPQLNVINLEAADASSAFEAIGGQFNCDRRGQLAGLEGVEGMLA